MFSFQGHFTKQSAMTKRQSCVRENSGKGPYKEQMSCFISPDKFAVIKLLFNDYELTKQALQNFG